jgi:8-oxo-dGTP pyrophosphatase MutT (NUDIX family)
MGGAWVFPGGAVDEADDLEIARQAVAGCSREMVRWLAAAARELVEEAGIWLLESGAVVSADRPAGDGVFSTVLERGERFAGRSLQYFANWITPEPLPVRFDTRFFAAIVPVGLEPVVDRRELVDARWIHPRDAFEPADTGEWEVALPTRKILDFLASFGSIGDVRDHMTGRRNVEPIQPRLAMVDEEIAILLPGDPGFDDAAGDPKPALLSALERTGRSKPGMHPETGSRRPLHS